MEANHELSRSRVSPGYPRSLPEEPQTSSSFPPQTGTLWQRRTDPITNSRQLSALKTKTVPEESSLVPGRFLHIAPHIPTFHLVKRYTVPSRRSLVPPLPQNARVLRPHPTNFLKGERERENLIIQAVAPSHSPGNAHP